MRILYIHYPAGLWFAGYRLMGLNRVLNLNSESGYEEDHYPLIGAEEEIQLVVIEGGHFFEPKPFFAEPDVSAKNELVFGKFCHWISKKERFDILIIGCAPIEIRMVEFLKSNQKFCPKAIVAFTNRSEEFLNNSNYDLLCPVDGNALDELLHNYHLMDALRSNKRDQLESSVNHFNEIGRVCAFPISALALK